MQQGEGEGGSAQSAVSSATLSTGSQQAGQRWETIRLIMQCIFSLSLSLSFTLVKFQTALMVGLSLPSSSCPPFMYMNALLLCTHTRTPV